jgi:hypothetical protein
MSPLSKGSKVSWVAGNGAGQPPTTGHGVCIADPDDTGHVLVAVLSDGEKHHVIWCTVTWLTVEA